MKLVSGDEVHRLLDYPGLVEALRQAHRTTPPEVSVTVRNEPGGGENVFVSLIAWAERRVIATKLVGVFPGNLKLDPPQPSVQGLVAVFDAKTGGFLFGADGAAMTVRKTAGDSALGASLLARPDAANLLVIGAGGLAPHVLQAHARVRPIRRALIWNRTHTRAKALAADAKLAGVAVEATEDLDGAVREADIISCVTMSTAPLVKGDLLKPGAHVDLVGAYLPTLREADDRTMTRGSLFVDTRGNMEGAGDLRQPVDRGLITWSDVKADLYELCSGTVAGRRDEREITVYKNVGGGHLDMFTAEYLARRLGLPGF